MRLDGAVGVITDTGPMGGYRTEGGLGAAVIEVLVGKDTPPLPLAHLTVRIMSGSGTRSELLAAAAIDAPTRTAEPT